ncbi:lethal(3)malignant brain tumor-like protein 3 isoform X3 [Brachypodium distachyon]|nr:lethal(3)malignant brain tumor-like protein 3 isoform X3 [Brachypodium distachyon]XP_014757018.1 lethal(3)malignant brain tumor-like protein 3 isoform X3 [Brachypodium distachyon]|eukprot:XP_014757017.1 lethal(3)malignant brain tumor-like protein 3 isoform X3 [Brachypodium distachyon]
MLQRNEDGHSPDKRFGSDRLGADSEDPDSEDHMPIPHAGPRRAVADLDDPSLDVAPVAASVSAGEKHVADTELSRTMKRKKTTGRQPKPKPMVVGDALTATRSQTCIVSEIPASSSPRAEPSTQATGETETTADPTSLVQEVGPGIDASSIAQAETSAAGTAPSSAAPNAQTRPLATDPPRQPAEQPQQPQTTATLPPQQPPQPQPTQLAAAQARKTWSSAIPAGQQPPSSSGSPSIRGTQGVPLRTTSGQSWGSLGQYAMDWNNVDSYEVNSDTIQTAQQNALVGSSPVAATPESLAARMFQARVALFESSRAAESCMNKRNSIFKLLLASHRKLTDKHKALVAEQQSKMSELLTRVAEVQGEKTQLIEQHRDEVARLRAQLEAQVEAHKAEVVLLTSALSAQAKEKIRLEGEVQKI